MEKLNLRIPKSYNFENESESVEPRIKFYCVSEGATEESYFYGVRNNKVELNIKNDVYIEVIEKQKGQETLSHPMQLVNACLFQMGRIDAEGNQIPEDKWKENCKWDDFDMQADCVCVIFDRDYRKLEESLDTIFDLCNQHRIKVIMSNPNFELWLLMHFPNLEQYSPKMLLDNKKNLRHQLFDDASTNKKYLEILVSKNAEGYSKGSKIRFERFLPFVDRAIGQAKIYSEDIKSLVDNLGTSMGRLMEEMRS
ncbi:RloB family protein [Parablautia muri]|uniref:RloB family protein n=1 Tax=Parablautia muri TaxID=2320879 RepID=UPI001368C60C|nr:RloB family protein [Parablautia muri]